MIISFYYKKINKQVWGQLWCLRENPEKYKNFSIQKEKEVTKIDKYGNKSVVTISYKIKFIDNAIFMATSLSNFVDNLTEELHKIKYKDCDCFFEYESIKDNLIKYKCLSAIKIIQIKLTNNWKIDSRTHLSFLIMISINLFCC